MVTIIMEGTMSVVGTLIMTTTIIGMGRETRVKKVDFMFHMGIDMLD